MDHATRSTCATLSARPRACRAAAGPRRRRPASSPRLRGSSRRLRGGSRRSERDRRRRWVAAPPRSASWRVRRRTSSPPPRLRRRELGFGRNFERPRSSTPAPRRARRARRSTSGIRGGIRACARARAPRRRGSVDRNRSTCALLDPLARVLIFPFLHRRLYLPHQARHVRQPRPAVARAPAHDALALDRALADEAFRVLGHALRRARRDRGVRRFLKLRVRVELLGAAGALDLFAHLLVAAGPVLRLAVGAAVERLAAAARLGSDRSAATAQAERRPVISSRRHADVARAERRTHAVRRGGSSAAARRCSPEGSLCRRRSMRPPARARCMRCHDASSDASAP